MKTNNKKFRELTEEELGTVIGGTNWSKFGQCALQHGSGAIPQLAELTAAIMSNNWPQVAILANSKNIKNNPVVTICLNQQD